LSSKDYLPFYEQQAAGFHQLQEYRRVLDANKASPVMKITGEANITPKS
jgi:hypothetical protein